jgi:hypothetical protein
MLACKKTMNTDKVVDISVKNLARVHQRNRELQARVDNFERLIRNVQSSQLRGEIQTQGTAVLELVESLKWQK